MNKVFATIIIICMILIASIALGKDIYVDDDAKPGGNGSPEHPFQYIQDGIGAALPRDEVLVAEGRYEENITLKSGVEVIGEGADVTTITASSGDVATADGVGFRTSISGFTIDGQGRNRYGLYCLSSPPTIGNVIISNTGDDGIYCVGASPTLNNVTISDIGDDGIYCEFDCSPIINNVTISGTGSTGIKCVNSFPTISNVIISNAGKYGIYCSFSSPTINNVTISNTGHDGIYCISSSLPTISSVTIIGAGDDGIYCSGSSSPTISNVTINGTGNNGIYCSSSSPPISDAIINSVEKDGIYCSGSSSPTIINCEIRYSGNNGIGCATSSYPTIRESIITQNYLNGISIDNSSRPDIGTEAEPGLNEIFNNGNYDVYSENTAEIKAELNCWGECPPNPAYFSGNIDYDPWLCTAINGTVTDAETGNPIKSAIVIAVNADTKEKYIAVTNSEGYFEILGVPSGTYWVICIKKGYKAGIKRVKVACGDTIVVDFKLSPKQE